MNQENNSRRDFLLTGLAVAGLATGCSNKKDVFEAAADDQVVASGKKVKLLSVDGEVIEVDEAFLKPVPHMPPVSNSEARKGIPGKKFVMVIDLSR
ncbi:MAG: 4Fe-4S dicluster domain-containing protein, partial [Mucilaginibacter sp.]